jgi:RNA polymerase sigma-70 factor (ECF subfamily)
MDARVLAGRLKALLPELPAAQRQVFVLRDVEGTGAGEVCEMLGVSEGNQRVLLHRARSRLRGMLEREIGRV